MAYEPDDEHDPHEPFYRPDYAPIPRRVASWWTVREAWVAIAATLAGITLAGSIIWLLFAVGAALTEH